MQRDRTPCKATRANGERCKSPAVRSSGYCWAHDPGGADARQEARREGGRAKSRARRLDKLVPTTLRPTLGLLLDALEEVHGGTLQPNRATAMAALASAAIRVYEVAEIEQRLDALEHQAEGKAEA